MLNYQSTSFHDALYLRSLLGLRRAPEFEEWLGRMQLLDGAGMPALSGPGHRRLAAAAGLPGP
jgi:ethanolamine ammonia-lyase large subunit